MLFRADHRDGAAALPMEAQQLFVVGEDQQVAVREEEGAGEFPSQQAQPAPCAQRLVLIVPDRVEMFLVFAEIRLDQLLFIVHDAVELRAAVLPELAHDVLHDGQIAHRDQGLWQDLGVRLKARALAARHDDHGDAEGGALLRNVGPAHHDIRQITVLVHHGDGNAAALGQQTERLLPAVGDDGVMIA